MVNRQVIAGRTGGLCYLLLPPAIDGGLVAIVSYLVSQGILLDIWYFCIHF